MTYINLADGSTVIMGYEPVQVLGMILECEENGRQWAEIDCSPEGSGESESRGWYRIADVVSVTSFKPLKK